ncbi:MAG TPA: type VI secretion system baseplate subunit TssG [Bryobacteraceae bacterium]|nr:type VI secretion system baseplate subunit TssG [Bryobacteraceae bacterium]
MATPGRSPHPAVVDADTRERLWSEPWSFAFFQAVRLLSRLYPQRQQVGREGPPSEEVVRFVAHNSTGFPASEVQALETTTGDRPARGTRAPALPPARMSVNFMGLTGPQGVLPLYYTELVRDRVRAGDYALRDFLDLFNHRMVSLFYRSWEKYHFAASYERGETSPITRILIGLIGLGTPGLENQQAVPDQALVFYAGLLNQQPRSAIALRHFIMDYFAVPAEVEQFVGCWKPLSRDELCALDEGGVSDSGVLGLGAVAGDEVWSAQTRARVVLGPLSLDQYLDFLPGGSAFEPLRAITRFFAGNEIDFEVQLILRREEAPRCELGAQGGAAPRLGWVSWAKTTVMQRDPAETIFEL